MIGECRTTDYRRQEGRAVRDEVKNTRVNLRAVVPPRWLIQTRKEGAVFFLGLAPLCCPGDLDSCLTDRERRYSTPESSGTNYRFPATCHRLHSGDYHTPPGTTAEPAPSKHSNGQE